MVAAIRTPTRPGPGLSFILLCVLLVTLWVAGGSSRDGVLGQVIVRGVAWLLMCLIILFGEVAAFKQSRAVTAILLAAVALALAQLVPLPPAVWQTFPGRHLLADAAAVTGQIQPWRPWSIVPGATLNAANSLIVPVVTLLLVTNLSDRENRWLLTVILGLVASMTLMGLIKFAGVNFINPFANDSPTEISGMFANRNHFALFLAMGCVLAPVWSFGTPRVRVFHVLIALACTLLFVLAILASGSRAGFALGAIALTFGLVLAQRSIRQTVTRYPRWVFPLLIGLIVVAIAGLVAISFFADRAFAINRLVAVDPTQDLRSRTLPTVLLLVSKYFPLGGGLGSFDPLFRIDEPLSLLRPTYFNHAHNDFIEIVLDTGIAGAILLTVALAWWSFASFRAWRSPAVGYQLMARLGSVLLLLIFIASAFDYPARTPIIMAMIVISGVWLGRPVNRRGTPALPGDGRHL